MNTKQFTLTITKEGLKAQGGIEIPSPFFYKGEITGVSFNTDEPGAGYSGGIYLTEESESPVILEGQLQGGPRGLRAENIGGLAKEGCIVIDDTADRVVTIDDAKFIDCVKTFLAARLGCETTDIA